MNIGYLYCNIGILYCRPVVNRSIPAPSARSHLIRLRPLWRAPVPFSLNRRPRRCSRRFQLGRVLLRILQEQRDLMIKLLHYRVSRCMTLRRTLHLMHSRQRHGAHFSRRLGICRQAPSTAPPLRFALRRPGPAPLPSSSCIGKRRRHQGRHDISRSEALAHPDVKSLPASPSAWDSAIRPRRFQPRPVLHPAG